MLKWEICEINNSNEYSNSQNYSLFWQKVQVSNLARLQQRKAINDIKVMPAEQ